MRIAISALLLSAALAFAVQATQPTLFDVVPFGTSAYRIDNVNNPTLTLTRGRTYEFNVDAPGHPFYIKQVRSTGTGGRFDTGVTGQGVQQGTLTFVVPASAPNTLFYDCSLHLSMSGTLTIVNRGVPGLSPALAAALALLVAGIGALMLRRRTA